MSVINCISCGKKVVAEKAHIILSDVPNLKLPPVYQCNVCSTGGDSKKTATPDSLVEISGVCHVIKKSESIENIKKAVENVQQAIEKMELVSVEETNSLVDQTGFELMIFDMWVSGRKVYFSAKILDTPQGNALQEEIQKTGKIPEVRIRWGWNKEAVENEDDGVWKQRNSARIVDINGEIPMVELLDNEKKPEYINVLYIDSVYIHRSWWSKLKKKLFGK